MQLMKKRGDALLLGPVKHFEVEFWIRKVLGSTRMAVTEKT